MNNLPEILKHADGGSGWRSWLPRFPRMGILLLPPKTVSVQPREAVALSDGLLTACLGLKMCDEKTNSLPRRSLQGEGIRSQNTQK